MWRFIKGVEEPSKKRKSTEHQSQSVTVNSSDDVHVPEAQNPEMNVSCGIEADAEHFERELYVNNVLDLMERMADTNHRENEL